MRGKRDIFVLAKDNLPRKMGLGEKGEEKEQWGWVGGTTHCP